MIGSVKNIKEALFVDVMVVAVVFCGVATPELIAASASGGAVVVVLFAALTSVLFGYATGLFSSQPLRLGQGFRRGTLTIAGCLISGIASAAIAGPSNELRIAFLLTPTLSGAAMIGARALRAAATSASSSHRRVLIIGPSEAIDRLLSRMAIAGGSLAVSGTIELQPRAAPSEADLYRIAAFECPTRGARIIVVAGAADCDPGLSHALARCKDAGCQVVSLVDFMADQFGRVPLEDPEEFERQHERNPQRSIVVRLVERAIDLTTVAFILPLALPIMGVIAAAIALEGTGSIIYRQTRIGHYGKPFVLFKFRTMIVDAEANGRGRWAERNDARVTPLGAFLRAHRLDEFPQLFNVLLGDMSLVGPRPEQPDIVADLTQAIPLYHYRHLARPGLTGWAQINFPYAGTLEETREKTSYDLFYVLNRGPLLTILIVLQTIRVVIFAEGSR